MRRRDRFDGWGRAVALAALAVFVLAGITCCFDHDGIDDHDLLMGFCWLSLVVPAVALALQGLAQSGLTPLLGPPALAAFAATVPKPPPRRRPLS